MKKTYILLVVSLFFIYYAVGQTYQPLEDQRVSTGNDVRFKSINVTGNITVAPGTIPATAVNTLNQALNINSDYVKTGPASVVYVATNTSDATVGTYSGISPTNVSGSGTGLVLRIVVNAGTFATTPTVTSQGTGYKSGDVLTIPKSTLGGPAGTYTVVIGNINTSFTFAADNAPIRLTTYLQEAGFAGAFTPFFRGSALGRDGSALNLARMDFGIYWDNINRGTPAILSSGAVSVQFTSSGIVCNTATVGTVNATTSSISALSTTNLTNNNGVIQSTGLNANSSFQDNVTRFRGNTPTSGNSFSAITTINQGAVANLTITSGGSGYTSSGFYQAVATGGSGTGLNLNLNLTGGVVTSVTPNPGNPGTGYMNGDVISAAIPGGSGFTATVTIRSGDNFAALFNGTTFRSSTADNYYTVRSTPVINNVAGYTGTVYGFYHNPTLTSLVGKHIAWQNVTGDVYLGTTSGNVGIGTTSPGSYKLAVEGTIGARRVKVTQAAWADYVFDSTYQLASLQEVEQFIQQNKHLPDVPSAAEVKKEGLDLGDNQAVLLKKIEELTLYIIEQNKQLEVQKQQLKIKNKALENRLTEIERLLTARAK
jgi:hypothetical protein